MANPNSPTTFGHRIREARLRMGLGLRELARQLDLTPSYISDIENDRRIPAEDVIRQLGVALELSFDDLMSLAGRLGDQTERYLKEVPAAATLFRKISADKPSSAAVNRLTELYQTLAERNLSQADLDAVLKALEATAEQERQR